MNHVLIGPSRNQNSHIQLSLGMLKSSAENVIMVFPLSVLPSFCIRKTTHSLSSPDFSESYKTFFLFERFSIMEQSSLIWIANFLDSCLKAEYFSDFIHLIPDLWLKLTYVLTNKTKKGNKIEKNTQISRFLP